MKKRATPNTPAKNGTTNNTSRQIIAHDSNVKPPANKKGQSKLERTLILLLEAHNRGLNALEARHHHRYTDTCLNTSISILRNQYKLDINGKSEPHTTPDGAKTRFHRYTLANASSRFKALNLVNSWRVLRGAEPFRARGTS